MSELMEQAYGIAVSQFKDKPFAFNLLWKEVAKKAKIPKQEEPNLIGRFYLDLLQDPRFVHVGDRKWRLRITMKYEEWDKISQSMFGIKEYYEEGYEDFQIEKEEDTEELGPNMSNEDNVSDTNYVESLLNTENSDDEDSNQ